MHLYLLILIPLIGALTLILIPAKHQTLIKWISALFGLLGLMLSIHLYFVFDKSVAGMQFVETIPWIPSFWINFRLGLDGLSLSMVLMTSIIWFTGILVSWNLQERIKEFFIYMFILVAGVFGVFLSLDFLILFIFLEIAVIPKFVLIHVWGSGKKEYSAIKYTLYLLTGSAFAFIAMMMIYLQTTTLDLTQLATLTYSAPFQKIIFLLLLIGFGVIIPLWPLHRWTPDGHSSAPTAISMLLAGVIMKLGGYALIRIGIGLFPIGAAFWAPLIATIAVVNCLYIAFVAMVQKDLKYVVANSSISHMGYVLMGLAAMNTVSLTGAAAQMFAHGIMAALFFALVGLIYQRTHTRMIADLGGLAHQMPRAATLFLMTGLASLGLPGFYNFVSEFLIFVGAFRTFPVLATIAILAVVITAIYVLRVTQQIFFGPRNPRWDGLKDISGLEMIPLVILVVVMLGFGLIPAPMTNLINQGIDPIVQHEVMKGQL